MLYSAGFWQAETMFGPFCVVSGSTGIRKQAKLIAIIDDASRVLCYGEFFSQENPDTMRDFLLRELDRAGLGHHMFTQPAVDLIVRSADAVLRKARSLSVGCLVEAVHSANKTIHIDSVNRVLMQPHWQKDVDLVNFESRGAPP